MGLAGPKKNNKISQDPNNTRWMGNTDSFGLKMMAAQGWQPGQYLGAKDANHAEHYTIANASHIRVTIREDNLGLGAKVGSGVGHGECTGLDAFKDLLGRLNGKEEDEIKFEQKKREDLKRAIYTERKWGSVRFVPGGFLIGDKIQVLIDAEAERIRNLRSPASDSSSSDSEVSGAEVPAPVERTKKSKRKRDQDNEPERDIKMKKSKKKHKLETENSESSPNEKKSTIKMKKEKEKREKKVWKAEVEDGQSHLEAEKARRKSEKKEKKLRKEAKRKARLVEASNYHPTKIPTEESTPSGAGSGQSTPIMMQGRHAVRARNIAQKRLASMDVASLNQIFMIKAPS